MCVEKKKKKFNELPTSFLRYLEIYIEKVLIKNQNFYNVLNQTFLEIIFFWSHTKFKFSGFLKEDIKNVLQITYLGKFFFLLKTLKKKKIFYFYFIQIFFQIFSFFLFSRKFYKKKIPFIQGNSLSQKSSIHFLRSGKIFSKKFPKKIYSLRKFLIKGSKIKNTIIFKQKDQLHPIKKFKNHEKILNTKFLYDRFNFLLHKNSIRGFTHDSFSLIRYILEKFIKDVVKNLRKIALSRHQEKKKEWGIKNIHTLKEILPEILRKKRTKEKQEKIFQGFIRLFKKKKKLKFNLGRRKNSVSKNFFPKNTSKKISVRRKIIDDNISKTNKTLMTLLNGILQKRTKLLRDATKCLSKYKPLPLQLNLPNRNQKHQDFTRKIEEEVHKKFSLSYDNTDFSVGPEDCLVFLKSIKKDDYPKFFSKWFFSVVIDHNFRPFKEIS